MEFLRHEPDKFFVLADIIEKAPKGTSKEVTALIREIGLELEKDLDAITDAVNSMNEENRVASKEENRFKPILELQQEIEKASPTAAGFLWVCHAVIKELSSLYRTLGNISAALSPPEIRKIPIKDEEAYTYEGMKKLHLMIDMNGPAMNKYFGLAFAAEGAERHVIQCVRSIVTVMEPFHRMLLKRHSDEGVEIATTPILTDVALTMFKNVDLNGELEGGTDPDKISAYTIRRGQIIARAIQDDPMGMFVRSTSYGGNDILSFISDHINKAWAVAQRISGVAKQILPNVKLYLEPTEQHRPASKNELDRALLNMRDLDPNLIRYRDKSAVLSPEEQFQTKFTNETVRGIINLILSESANAASIVEYIIKRKSDLNKHNRDENSFYVCRIGAGNKLKEKAPGELEVIPGERPKVDLSEIRGSGYDEVREFAKTIESSEEYRDLFIATSPSKTADKSNVLLIGPPGCVAGGTFVHYEIRSRDGRRINHKGGPIERLFHRFNNLPQDTGGSQWSTDVGFFAPSVNDEGRITQNRIVGVVVTGEKECFEVVVRGGEKIIATPDHKFFVGDGYVELSELRAGMPVFVHRNIFWRSGNSGTRANKRVYLYIKHHPICGTKLVNGLYEYKRLARSRAVMEAHINGISLSSYIDKLNEGKLEGLTFLARDMHVHHEDENIRNDSLENLKLINGIQHNKEHRIQNHNSMRYEVIEDEIISITKAGIHKTFDVKMAYPFHNYIANGIVVHNCGKSQVMRAIGAERGSIAIFAQGSDFLTCWQGEAEKNPKRLFLAAVRLRQESKRHVHLLLDEADSVLKKPEDRKSTDIDLTLEFQILLDGVVNYPGITLWGATNSPGKIPMALIRRFNKVLIVGELSLEDRAKLLEMFCRALPTVDFDSRTWLRLAERLDGATGDVVRKVIDHVWRFCIDGFVASKPEEAKNLVKWLNTCNHDGGGFDISKFKASDFIELGERLRKYTKIIPRDVENSVEAHLKNPAVRAEIETAKATYKEARELLTDLGRSKIQIVAG